MTEKNFRKSVIKFLREMPNITVEGIEGQRNGFSDLLITYKGRAVFCELKGSTNSNGKKNYYDVTEQQKLFLKKKQDNLCIAFVLRHSENWKEELIDYLNEDKIYEINLIDWDNL